MNIKEQIGLRIKELRRSKHMSQETLSEIMGISSKYLSSIERGKENPTLDTLVKLSAALDVEMSGIFTFSHQGMTSKELKAFISGAIKDIDADKLKLAAKVVKAISE